MPGLRDRDQDNGPWGSVAEVPERFQKVAAGEEGAGPVSVSALHEASHAPHSHHHAHAEHQQQGDKKEPSASAKSAAKQRFGQVEAGEVKVSSREEILEAMRDVIDPELGINIVDLGLVYGVEISPQNLVVIEMTLTSAACPLTDMIEEQTRMVLTDLASEVHIEWVWMPPWGPDRITPEGREQLRSLGFNV